MMPQQVTTLRMLNELAENGRAVVVPTWRGFKKPKPAKFVLGMTAGLVYRMMRDGMYVYIAGRRQPAPNGTVQPKRHGLPATM